MTISGLQIANFQRELVKDEFLNGGEKAAQTLLRAAWSVAVGQDKFADLNAPFDFFLAQCEKNEHEQKAGVR